jgi:hypothetical protein
MTPVIAFAKELPGHPPKLPPGVCHYVWLEGVMKARLLALDQEPDWSDPALWPAGRLFGPEGEYRWQKNDDDHTLHAILILDNGDLPSEFLEDNRRPLEALEATPGDNGYACLILWGEWVNPDEDPQTNPPPGGPIFYAREIPPIQTYPITMTNAVIQEIKEKKERGPNPRLIVRRYQHPEAGEFSRCVGFAMKADPDKEK